MQVYANGLKAEYNDDTDILVIGLTNPIDTDEDLRETGTFRSMFLYTTNFGEPTGLEIKGFKENVWHMNRDLLKLAIIMHFDETEAQAHYIVDKIFSSYKL